MNLVTHPLFLAALCGSVVVILWPRPQEGEESSEDETTETKDEFGTQLEEPPTPEVGDEDTAEGTGAGLMRQLAAIEAHEANTRRPVAVPTGRRTRTIAIAAAVTVLAGAGFIAGHAASLGGLRTAGLYATNLTVDVDVPEVVTWDHFQGSGGLDGSPSPTGGTWDVISSSWQYQGSSAVGVTNNSPNALAE